MKYSWWLLPFATLWLCFWLGYLLIDNNPFENWWSYPFVLTLIISFFVSILVAVTKIRGDRV